MFFVNQCKNFEQILICFRPNQSRTITELKLSPFFPVIAHDLEKSFVVWVTFEVIEVIFSPQQKICFTEIHLKSLLSLLGEEGFFFQKRIGVPQMAY